MAFYIITGKLGSGKSLVAVSKIKERVEAGCRVATNLDLNTEFLLPLHKDKIDLIRLPDLPTVEDLQFLGQGSQEHAKESKFGLIVLDEGSGNFNAREWADKSRQAMIDWLKHSRKYRWDVYIIVQSINMLDKQIRESFGEHVVICRRLDRIPIPILSTLFSMILVKVRAPKIHLGIVRYGTGFNDPIVDRWIYKGTSLYKAYDTEQVFDKNSSPGLFNYLSPYSIKGRYMNKFQLAKLMTSGLLVSSFAAGFALCLLGTWFFNSKHDTIQKPPVSSNAQSPTNSSAPNLVSSSVNTLLPNSSASLSIAGFVKQGNSVHVFLNDGSDFVTQEFSFDASGLTVTRNGQQLKQAK